MIRTIEDRWLDFRASCISLDAHPDLLRELRVVFYAGFKSMLDANMEIAELHEIEAIVQLEQLHIESRRFGASLPTAPRRT